MHHVCLGLGGPRIQSRTAHDLHADYPRSCRSVALVKLDTHGSPAGARDINEEVASAASVVKKCSLWKALEPLDDRSPFFGVLDAVAVTNSCLVLCPIHAG